MTTEELQKLTPDYKRKLIAEYRGISNVQMRPWYGYKPDGDAISIPDYPNSLEDGYKSWSPAEAFESGYSEIKKGAGQ